MTYSAHKSEARSVRHRLNIRLRNIASHHIYCRSSSVRIWIRQTNVVFHLFVARKVDYRTYQPITARTCRIRIWWMPHTRCSGMGIASKSTLKEVSETYSVYIPPINRSATIGSNAVGCHKWFFKVLSVRNRQRSIRREKVLWLGNNRIPVCANRSCLKVILGQVG